MLEARDLSFGYTQTDPLFSRLSLSIPEGSSLGILGPSGSGKSTLIRLLSGKLKADDGDVFHNGNPVIATGRDLTFEKAFLYELDQGIHLPKFRQVRELFQIRLRHLSPAEASEFLLRIATDFGIETLLDQKTETLSLGQAQRAGLALAVCRPSQYILLDEPFSHQDPLSRQRLLFQLLRYRKEQGLTFVVASHTLEDCLILTERAIFFKNSGEIEEFANWSDLFHREADPQVRAYYQFVSGPVLAFSGMPNPPEAGMVLKESSLGSKELKIGYDTLGFPEFRLTP